ncbi:TOG array regulator of axonemal microtubules protein 1 [Trichonephila inaurata madagascariensis]|uniref:TOG array regulator of axonemal microtubules protein 1 n=1 Tax=Trichonephila inaurata madagascariensis TaxID=2747483 RepID=A0A8X6MBV5_9ARAC|nr:TOG array regulator of axonemal microtubules protein 1 [Trichonephila inaurata madagascariensis]
MFTASGNEPVGYLPFVGASARGAPSGLLTKYSRRSENFRDHQNCQETSSCRGESEIILMQLRRLWKTLLNKNEKSRFEERKLCRTRLVKFLDAYIFNPCERVRFLALDLLCGTVPRLDDKTDSLLRPLMPKVIHCLDENSAKDVKMKALHFLRIYDRYTKNLRGFIETFCLLGIENGSDAIKISCFHGVNIIFDRDIGDKMYSFLVPAISSSLRGNIDPSVFLSSYKALKRIHDRIQDERFYNLLSLAGKEAKDIYSNFYAFEETDPYLSCEILNLSALIAEYQKKRIRIKLNKVFGVLDPILLNRISATRECERAVTVNNFEIAFKRAPWNEFDLESHVLDLTKLICAFLEEDNRLIQISGLEILKEMIQRMGFHVAPYLKNLAEILRSTLVSPNLKIKSKTERILHKLMKNVHPMTVIWALLDDPQPCQREAILRFIMVELKCFPYCDFDLQSIFSAIGREMEFHDLAIQKAIRDCISLLLEIMNSSPVPGIKSQAISLLLENSRLQKDTLVSLGLTNGKSEELSEDTDSISGESTLHTVPSTSQTISSTMAPNSISCAADIETLKRQCHNRSSGSILSFAKQCNEDDQLLNDDGFLSEDYLSTLTSARSARTHCRRNPQLSSLQINSRGLPQSAASFECPEEERTNTSNFLTDTTLDKSSVGPPRHSSTPRRRWDLTPEGRQNSIPVAPKILESSVSNVLEAGDVPRYHRGTIPTSKRNETHLKPRAKRDCQLHDLECIGDGGWGNKYSAEDKNTEYCVERGEGDFRGTVATDIKSCTEIKSKNRIELNSKSTPTLNCQVELLNPKKYNFNILQISTPNTTESIQEFDELEGLQNKRILEVLPSSISSPGMSQMNTCWKSDKEKEEENTKQCKPSKPLLVTEYEKLSNKYPKNPSVKKCVVKVSPSSKEQLRFDDRKDSKVPFKIKNFKKDKISKNIYLNSKKDVPKTPSVEFPSPEPEIMSEPEIISEPECDGETLDSRPFTQESIGEAFSPRTESDIIEECLEESTLDYEQDFEDDTEDLDETVKAVEDEIMPDSLEKICHKNSKSVKTKELNQKSEKKIDSKTGHAKEYLKAENAQSSNKRKAVPKASIPSNKAMTENKAKEVFKAKNPIIKAKTIKTNKSTVKVSVHPISTVYTEPEDDEEILEEIHENTASEQSIEEDLQGFDDTVVTPEDEKRYLKKNHKITKPPFKKSHNKYLERGSTAQSSQSSIASKYSAETAMWQKGKEIPRTPVMPLKGNKALLQNNPKNKPKPTKAPRPMKPLEKQLKTQKGKLNEPRKEEKLPMGKDSDEMASVSALPEGVSPGCQWRDLEYAVKGGTCDWAQKFERNVNKMVAFPNFETADTVMRKAIDDLYGKAWKAKEEAMSVVIRLAKHHPLCVYDNIPKIVVAICNEVRNFRQSVAGKAVLTLGYLYEIMGKRLESKMRLVVGALLAKSGNRTLAAYFRLVIKSLFKIMNSTTAQKTALAFIHEGARHPNKASRETAAQFLVLLTEQLGPVNSLASPLASHMLKCATLFVFDCSALTRHCGKRMFQVFKNNRNFEKLKDHHLDINTVENLSKILEQIDTKGVCEEHLPINIIK